MDGVHQSRCSLPSGASMQPARSGTCAERTRQAKVASKFRRSFARSQACIVLMFGLHMQGTSVWYIEEYAGCQPNELELEQIEVRPEQV